jgi:hypothetical protein
MRRSRARNTFLTSPPPQPSFRFLHRVRPPDGCRTCYRLRNYVCGTGNAISLEPVGHASPPSRISIIRIRWCKRYRGAAPLAAAAPLPPKIRLHGSVATAVNPSGAATPSLPCGCAPYLTDGGSISHHAQHCKMSGARRRPAVIAMYKQLNELWYLAHVRCDRE